MLNDQPLDSSGHGGYVSQTILHGHGPCFGLEPALGSLWHSVAAPTLEPSSLHETCLKAAAPLALTPLAARLAPPDPPPGARVDPPAVASVSIGVVVATVVVRVVVASKDDRASPSESVAPAPSEVVVALEFVAPVA